LPTADCGLLIADFAIASSSAFVRRPYQFALIDVNARTNRQSAFAIPQSHHWLLAVRGAEELLKVISVLRLRARPATVLFDANGFAAPIPLA
jgi:hypothetical protein